MLTPEQHAHKSAQLAALIEGNPEPRSAYVQGIIDDLRNLVDPANAPKDPRDVLNGELTARLDDVTFALNAAHVRIADLEHDLAAALAVNSAAPATPAAVATQEGPQG